MPQISLGQLHPITSSLRVPNADPKQTRERFLAVCKVDLAVDVNIILANGVLSLHDLAAQLDFLAVLVKDVDLVGLVTTGPNDPVSLLDVWLLIIGRFSADELDSFLISFDDIAVKLFGIASEACESVD